jgi:hypothetical protein
VPYRDSTLTRLLRDSFGGKASTTVVVCVAGCEEWNEETVRSLEFGKRLGGVRSKSVARVAALQSGGAADRRALEAALAAKKRELASLDGGGVNPAASTPAKAEAFRRELFKLDRLKQKLKRAEENQYVASARTGEDGDG